MSHFRSQKNENGGVFFYILLAVSLFAALSYAVSRNSGSSSNIFTDEQAKLAAQEIIEYGNTVASAVQKLRLRGCRDTEISFDNFIIAGYSHIHSPTDNSCNVFNTNGGNINFLTFSDEIYDTNITGIDHTSYNADNIVTNIGTDDPELIFFNSTIKENICLEINNILHAENFAYTVPDITVGGTKFTGTYNNPTPATICPGGADSKLSGCCFEATGGCGASGCYHFYQVLIAR